MKKGERAERKKKGERGETKKKMKGERRRRRRRRRKEENEKKIGETKRRRRRNEKEGSERRRRRKEKEGSERRRDEEEERRRRRRRREKSRRKKEEKENKKKIGEKMKKKRKRRRREEDGGEELYFELLNKTHACFLELMRTSFMWQMQRSFSMELPALVPLQLPSRMETHLWYVLPNEVNSTALLKKYSQLLSPPEKDKVLQMQGDELKKNALLARTLVRTTIARYQTADPRTLMFKKNMYGKPEVDLQNCKNCNNPPLHFNISHTNSLIACGVTVYVPVGIDLEDKERKIKHDVLAFAERFYSTEEVKFLTCIPDPEVQRKEFIKLWTLKEAYVKALGKGFSAAPFNTFTIQPKAGAKRGYNLCKTTEMPVNSLENTKNEEWKFALLELADSHYVAICMEDDQASEGAPMRVIVRKTIPLVEDELISDGKVL